MAFTLDDNENKLADEIVSEIPEPQQHAIDQANAEQAKESGEEIELDALGIPWDSSIHATGFDGKGVRTAKGAWRKRRGLSGSPSVLRTARSSQGAADEKSTDAPSGPSQVEINQRAAGAMAANMLIAVSVGVGGEEFLPGKLTAPGGVVIDERENLQGAFGDYFVAKNMADLPPGWALAAALCMYYLPRFQMPKTKERVQGFRAWFKRKVAQWKMRRAGVKGSVVDDDDEQEYKKAA